MMGRLLTAWVSLAIAVLACSCTPVAVRDGSSGTLAVLGAFNQEVTLLEEALIDPKPREIEGIRFVSGRIGRGRVVVVWTGVGKVNAAMVATLLIEHFKPTHVIFTGIAGAVDPNLEPGDIVIARRTAYHDMGFYGSGGIEPGGVKNRLTGDTNPVFFEADPNLLVAAERAFHKTAFDLIPRRSGERPPRVVVGTVVTGDTFVASKEKSAELAEEFEADAVEMEGAAVAQICYQRGIRCLVLRSISDRADESAVVDMQKFYALAAKNSAKLVTAILEARGP